MNNIYSSHVLLEACKVTDQVRRSIHFGTDYRETDEDAVGETMKLLNSYPPIRTLLRRRVLKCLSWHMVVNFYTYQSAHVCGGHGLLMVSFATGCIFVYDAQHPEGSWIGFTQEDKANFTGSFYLKTKAMVEELLKEFDNRDGKEEPERDMELHKHQVVSYNEIPKMYKAYIDPNFKWANFTLEEQAKMIVAPGSNNEMDATKLKRELPESLPIKQSLVNCVFELSKRT